MSSSISSIGSYAVSMAGMQRAPRPDSNKPAQDLFSQIDTTGKGYIEKADLESAFSQIASSASSSASSSSTASTADQLFSSLDSDGDGKVTQDEMSSGLKSLMESLDGQFQSSRMDQARGDMPPPPPPENDTGFTKDELQSQLDEIGGSDSKRSSLISSVIQNFDEADTDGDGKVSFQEAMALQQSLDSSSTTTAATGGSTNDGASSGAGSSQSGDAQLMAQIMKLAQAYGLFAPHEDGSSLSAIA